MVYEYNPGENDRIRARMYESYQSQIPMFNDVSRYSLISEQRGGGLSYNAYSEPDDYFYMPVRYGEAIYRKKIYPNKKQKSTSGSSYVGDKILQEMDEDWYNLSKFLIPLGSSIPQVMEAFKNKYEGKYVEHIIDQYMNQDVENFIDSADKLGRHQYQ